MREWQRRSGVGLVVASVVEREREPGVAALVGAAVQRERDLLGREDSIEEK
jgi:hypothetical protein